jgi:multidrug efflux pump subunit AcrA (membrane-fusion protein)
MTANVTIVLDERPDTLIVPLRAVETEGNQAYVNRVGADGATQRVPVKLGMLTETQAEIVEGVSEGDTVLVYASTTRGNNRGGMPMPFGGPR